MDRSQLIVAGVVVTVAVAGAVWYSGRAPEPPPVTLVHSAAQEQRTLTVHVSGAVASPGLVRLPAGSRVADAIAAAGGALPDAALGAVNLAAPLADAQHVAVPGASATGAGPGESRVPINTASPDDLEALPGVGPVLARRIVEHRDAYGPFLVLEDLLGVPGIGEAKLAALREVVQVP
jgi:competence protein ComEA